MKIGVDAGRGTIKPWETPDSRPFLCPDLLQQLRSISPSKINKGSQVKCI